MGYGSDVMVSATLEGTSLFIKVPIAVMYIYKKMEKK